MERAFDSRTPREGVSFLKPIAIDRCGILKGMGMYLLGYIPLLVASLLALWKTGVLASIRPFSVGVGLLVAVGLGIMIGVPNSGKNATIEVDRN